MPSLAAPSLPRRIVAAIVSPGELFATFTSRATPWADVLLVGVAAAAAAFLLLPHEVFVDSARAVLRSASGADAAGGGEAALLRHARAWMIAGTALGLVGTSVGMAALLTLVFSRILSGPGRFAQYRAVAAHAALILALGMVVTAPVQALRGDLSVQLSMALLAPSLEDGVLLALLRALNVFDVWMLVVLALGVSVVDRRRSWPGAGAILLGLYLGFVAAGAVLRG